MLDNSVIRLEVRSGAVSVIPAQKYQVYDSVTIVDAAGSLGEQPYVAVRQGNDLVLLYADGTEVVLQDYFLGDTLFSMDGLGGVIELPADMAPIGTVDGKALYAFGGSPDAAGSILAKSSSFSPLEPLLTDDTLSAALIGDGGNVGLALAGLGAGGLGLAAMGGGGGAAPFLGSVANAITVISGTFVAGPVIPGNGLVVDLYDNTGALLQAGIPLNEDGSFSVTLQGTFPNVIAIMRDLNENPDYRDEATGADTDLNATLMGLGAGDPQPNGTTNVALNINPVTTVAARLAGVSAEGEIPAGGVSPEKITESIQQVQGTFGLSDINGVAPKDIFDEDFDDTDGDIDDGEQYGQVLAMLSGKDKLNQGDQGATIEEFVSAIEDAGDDTAAAQSAVRSELLAGAREFEFNNQDGTETEADLLRAPSLGVERTPEVGEGGQTTEPEFSALLEDSLKGTSTGSGPNATADTIEGFQTLVDTADAIQALAALDTGAEIPQQALDQLTEENLTALGLTGLAAPSPYLDEFLEALRDAEAGGADTVAELQALLDDIIQDILTPSQDVTPNDDGTLSVSGTGEPGSTVTATFPDGTTGTAVVADDGSYGPITSEAPQTRGTVSVTATDEAGNTSDPSTEAYSDTTAPLSPSQDVSPNDNGTLSVSGTGEAGSTVTTTFPDGTTGTAVVAPDGSYGPITSAAPQTTGAVATRQSDAAGNTSPLTTEAYTDTTAPIPPTIGAVTPNEDGTLSVSGTGEPGSTATVSFPDGTIGAAVVGPDGTFGPITSSAPQTSGDVTATQTDGAGNVSPAETVPFSDTVGPQAPVLGAIEQNLDGTLSVSGTGEPGAIASVTFPDRSTGTTTVRPDGSFGPVTSDAPQTDGAVSAVQTDEAGNPSLPDAAEFDDGQAPLSPGNLVATSNKDGTIDVSGTGEPGSTATVTFPDRTTATALVGEDGTFGPVTSSATQTSGTVSATQTDEAGNISAPVATEAYFDKTPPLPVNLIVTPNDDGTIDVSGTGEPGSTATVIFPDGTSATALIGEDGAFGPVTSEAPQTTGPVTATQTDEANNVSEPSTEDYVDTNEPLNPTVGAVTPNDDGTLSISGTGEPGATMTVFFPDGTTATALVEADGSYGPVTSDAPQTSGDVIVNQTDEAGNQSDDVVLPYTDETAPLEPFIDTPTQNEDGTLSVSGTGEPGSTVQVTFPDGTVGSALVDDSGNFGPVTSAAPQTSGEVSATQTDEAGNTSDPATEAYSDTTAPEAPSQVITPNTDGTLSVSGTGEPGSTVTTEFPDGSTATAIVAADGSYGPITSEAPQTTGDVSVTATDAAGNTSEPLTEAYSDTTAPLSPSQDVTTNDDGTLSVSGTGEPGSTVTTTFPDGTTGTALVADDGTYGPITSEAPQTTGTVSSSQTDEAGNTSAPQSETVTDETAPLSPSQTVTTNDDGTLSVSGTGEPGSTVTTTFPDGTTGTAVVADDGSYGPITSEAPQTTGTVSSTQTDEAGNTSDPQSETVTDETAPLAPEQTVTTNDDGTLSVSGTGEPGSTVTTTFPDGTTGTALVADDGSYGPITSEAPQTTGTVSSSQTDEAGNTSAPQSETVTDETAPLSPSQTVTPNDDGTLSVSGTGEPGSTVTTTFPDGTTGTAVVADDGSYGPITSEAPQTTGTVSSTQTDEAGNTSDPQSETVTDETAPLAPEQTVTVNDDGTLSVSGTGEPGSTVTTTFPDGTTGTAVVADDGTYGPITSEAPQTSTDVETTQTDQANNTSQPAVDETAPFAPDVTSANADGLSGTAEPGSTVTLFDDSEPPVAIATATVDGDGNWSIPAEDFPGGTTEGFAGSVTATDAAGNTSEPTDVPAIDGTAPGAPSVDAANADGLSGTGTAGDVIALLDGDGNPVLDGEGNPVTATVGADGNWSIPAEDFPGGTTEGFAGSVTATDAAGNTSEPTDVPAIDGTAPGAPSVDAANADGLSGTGTAGDVIALLDGDGNPVLDGEGNPVTATVGADGTWSIPAEDFPGGTTEGFAGSVTATDAAGNTSAPTDVPAIDGTAPTITITTPIESDGVVNAAEDADVLVAGTTDAENGQIVTVTFTDSANATVTATATVSEGGWSLSGSEADISGLANGEITVTANVSDVAGNAATEASASVTLDNSAPTITITTPIETDGVVNAAEDQDVLVAGTTDAENGQTVTVTFTDSANATVTATATVSEGGWSLSGSEADISGLAEGEITVTANVSDAAGNAATEASAAVTLDNSAPTIAITPGIAGDDIVNASEDEDVFVAGTTDAENGQTVTVTFTDSANATVTATATVSAGNWSLSGSGTDISALANGEITVTANVSDAAGNAATEASATATLDNTVALPTINAGITDQANTVSGTGEPGATVSVSIMSGEGSVPVGSAVVWTDGTWSFVADTPIADGETLYAVQQDAAGNFSLQASQVTFTDTDGDGVANTVDTDDDGDSPDPVDVEVIDRLITVQADSSGPIQTTIPGTTGTEPSLITFSGPTGARATATGFRYLEGSSEANVGDVYTLNFDNPITDIKLFLDNMILGTNIGNFTVSYSDGTTDANLALNVIRDNVYGAARTGGTLTDIGTFTENGFNAVGDINAVPDETQSQDNAAQAGGTIEFIGLDSSKTIDAISWQITGVTTAPGAGSIGGFVTPIISYDRDPDTYLLPDATESTFESAVTTTTSITAATSNVTEPTTGYTETTRTVDGGSITIVADAPGERTAVGGNDSVGNNLGTQSSFTVTVDPVSTEVFDNATISIAINRFDDGLFVQIDDAVIVNFNAGDWFFNADGTQRTTGVNANFDTDNDGRWRPWRGEGNPSLEINTADGTVQLLVDTANGRQDVLAAIAQETNTFNSRGAGSSRDPRQDPLPTLDAAAFEAGVTITTAYNNLDGEGLIGVQTITVNAAFSGAEDIDDDGIDNWVDIDSDNDRIWDKYEGREDFDNDGVANYRDTDSDNNGTLDGVQESLTAAEITGLTSGSDTYDEGYILLSEAVTLDFTQIDDARFTADVEYIDMNDGIRQVVELNESEVIALTDADNELIIVGDRRDVVNATGFEDTGKDQSIQGQSFSIYEANGATLFIDDEITNIVTT